jgi:RimJ/RimL family protein N-acetyltransferase
MGASFPQMEGRHVVIRALEISDIDRLWSAAGDPRIWTYMTSGMADIGDMRRIVEAALKAAELGTEASFTIIERASGRIVGSTRYLDITPAHRNLEIGWTWLASDVWRTPINTECKLLLLTHAFESMGMLRVQLKTDARNERSQRAIERIGGVKEGVLRQHRILPDGYVRDTVMYSILDSEWRGVKERLEGMLSRPRP